MPNQGPSVHAPKRRRTNKQAPMIEDEDSALDTAMYTTIGDHPNRRKVLIPVRVNEPSNTEPEPEPEPNLFLPNDADVDMIDISFKPPRDRSFYMKEFVSRVDDILQALQNKEALSNPDVCTECAGQGGQWRCQDCFGGRVLCRRCMRHSHFSNPFHRIECWTGSHFRNAALWEVGVYLLLAHHNAPSLCANLTWQQKILEDFQQKKDQNISTEPGSARYPSNPAASGDHLPTEAPLDQILEEEEKEVQDLEADVHDTEAGMHGFVDYMTVNETNPEPEPDPDIPLSHTQSLDAPSHDALNNQYIRIVHTNGIHHIALACCTCRGKDLTHDLINGSMVPTSFTRIRTLFTTAVLDHFRSCNLEMKSSAYQFFQMLRRITNPLNPYKVVNLYHELRRLSRLWRWVKKLRWAGHAQKPGHVITPDPGSLGNFCPACPQVGINLPDGWADNPNQWLFRRVLTADGNFKADHVRQKTPADDIWLYDGLGMTTRRPEYYAFLKSALEMRTKAPCETTFRAIENSMSSSKACDITGIVAMACARHGCFAPNSIVDLFRGEQQKNVDWSFLEAIRTTGVHQGQQMMLIYDIMCQYFVHLDDRIGHLLPAGLEIDRAIGLFHVHDHKDQCFYRFASSFIPGAGIVAGEILETLWSVLNTISPSTRTATLAHRAEVLDDHATDSNHKKALAMATVLTDRYQLATEMVQLTGMYYDQMSSTVLASLKRIWEQEITLAESRRLRDPSAMDILGAREAESAVDPDRLGRRQPKGSGPRWLQLALAIEEQQLDIRDRVRRLRHNPREECERDVERRRQKLTADFLLLESLKSADNDNSIVLPGVLDDVNADAFDNLDDEDETGPDPADPEIIGSDNPNNNLPPEHKTLILPSTHMPTAHSLRKAELALRITQVKHNLTAVREAVAEKSFQYCHVMKNAPTTQIRTRTRSVITKINDQIAHCCRMYGRARAALVRLDADEAILSKFLVLSKDDVKASSAILKPNEPGSSSLRLSWIWQSRLGPAGVSSEAMQEFQRVHWLRARAQKMRWAEELLLVKHEMEWTTRYFIHRARVWQDRFDDPHAHPGPKAYAARQRAQWWQLAVDADCLFRPVNQDYVRLIT